MTNEPTAVSSPHRMIPTSLRRNGGTEVKSSSCIPRGERFGSSLEVDLNTRLHFVKGLAGFADQPTPADGRRRRWQLAILAAATRANACTTTTMRAWATWTLLDAQGLVGHLALYFGPKPAGAAPGGPVSGPTGKHRVGPPAGALALTQVCPSCKAPLEPDQEECPVCTKVVHTPPSTWTLFRLWRFAKPYRGQLVLGFVLTLLGTAATLVPPYLTMPFMDNVLIPFQNGQTIDPMLVALYMGGLLGSAALAVGAELGQDLHPGLGVGAHWCRFAHHDL